MTDLRLMTRQTWMPFAKVAAVWALVGLPLSLTGDAGTLLARMAWFVGVSVLCMIDLLAMTWVVKCMVTYAQQGSQLEPAKKAALGTQTLFYGALKVLCLGAFVVLLIYAKNAPSRSLLLGLATLVVVPLVGGFLWSRKELKYA